MTIAFSVAAAGNSTISTLTYTTASITPVAGELLLVAVISDYGGSASPANHASPTLTGNGLTWALVSACDYDSAAGNDSTWFGHVDLFRAQGNSPASGAVTIAYGSAPASAVLWHVTKVSGTIDTAGSAGDTCIVQAVITRDFNVTGSLSHTSCTMATFTGGTNAGYAVFAGARNPAASMTAGPGSGLVAIGSPQIIGFQSLFVETCLTATTTIGVSFNNLMGGIGGIAVELKDSVAATNTPGQLGMQNCGT